MHRLILTLCGVALVAGAAVSQNGPVEDVNRLDRDRQEAIVNELIRAQEQIQRALKRMLKESVPVNTQQQSGEAAYGSEESDGSDESDEEHEWQQMKRKKITEARALVERNIRGIASNFLDMGEYVDKIDKKVDEELRDQRENVNYNLYYKKPKPHRPRHSSEESDEHFYYKKRPARRGGRQLADPKEPTVEQQPEEVKIVEGEEVVQTLPVEGTE